MATSAWVVLGQNHPFIETLRLPFLKHLNKLFPPRLSRTCKAERKGRVRMPQIILHDDFE